jgi:hypothetical protein
MVALSLERGAEPLVESHEKLRTAFYLWDS